MTSDQHTSTSQSEWTIRGSNGIGATLYALRPIHPNSGAPHSPELAAVSWPSKAGGGGRAEQQDQCPRSGSLRGAQLPKPPERGFWSSNFQHLGMLPLARCL